MTVVSGTVRIGTVVMHHPSRSELLDSLLPACAELCPRVIVDPHLEGVPSPLRTAKLAWRAVDEQSTHHLVLQDDIVLAPGFVSQAYEAVRQRPAGGVALFTSWQSPQNSYHVRRAAAIGVPWAPLSPGEWTPAVGLVFPAADALDLAEFLAHVPDDARDDDEMISAFCRERSIRVAAAVPHLIEHRPSASLSNHDGAVHSTVYAGAEKIRDGHWIVNDRVDAALSRRAMPRDSREFTVEFAASTCRIRFLRPGSGEPVGHAFGWYWHDWIGLTGIDSSRILDACGSANPTLIEIYAAGYLLGHDAARTIRMAGLSEGDVPGPENAEWLRESLATWIQSGLHPRDRDRYLREQEQLEMLTNLMLDAVRRSWQVPYE